MRLSLRRDYTGPNRNRRVWVGTTADGTASVSLMDANGRNRIVMQVRADGTPSLVFLDDKGHMIQQLVPTVKP